MIVVTVRTRNEQGNIARFINSYWWADKILVADGGSSDDTVRIASQMDKTSVRLFGETVSRNGVIRNPHGRHMNFLWDWAIEEGADFIIFDDCDCVPNKRLQEIGRSVFDNLPAHLDAVFSYRLYIYGKDQFFPKISYVGQSIWGWRASAPVRADESDPFKHHVNGVNHDKGYYLKTPFVLLHYAWPSDQAVNRKLNFYQSYKPEGASHPTDFGGKLMPLPDFAKE